MTDNPFVPDYEIEISYERPAGVPQVLSIKVKSCLDADGCGPLYTREEWGSDDMAAWELTERGLLRQGQVVDGSSFRKLP